MVNQLLNQSPLRALIVLTLLFSNKLNAQSNLVPNPSFEQFMNCPQNTISSRISYLYDWYKPDKGGANYFNRCTNNQPTDGVPYNFGGGGD
jgi:OmpA-OmpF porin, OOP family